MVSEYQVIPTQLVLVDLYQHTPGLNPFELRWVESGGTVEAIIDPAALVDGSGNLMLFFRGLTLPDELHDPANPQFQSYIEQRQGAGAGWRTSIWFTFMSRYDGVRWDIGGKHQKALPGSNGRSDSPFSIALLDKGGVAYALTGDPLGEEPFCIYEPPGRTA